MKKLILALLIIGGINWGLIGFFKYNLVDSIFGPDFFEMCIRDRHMIVLPCDRVKAHSPVRAYDSLQLARLCQGVEIPIHRSDADGRHNLSGLLVDPFRGRMYICVPDDVKN